MAIIEGKVYNYTHVMFKDKFGGEYTLSKELFREWRGSEPIGLRYIIVNDD